MFLGLKPDAILLIEGKAADQVDTNAQFDKRNAGVFFVCLDANRPSRSRIDIPEATLWILVYRASSHIDTSLDLVERLPLCCAFRLIEDSFATTSQIEGAILGKKNVLVGNVGESPGAGDLFKSQG